MQYLLSTMRGGLPVPCSRQQSWKDLGRGCVPRALDPKDPNPNEGLPTSPLYLPCKGSLHKQKQNYFQQVYYHVSSDPLIRSSDGTGYVRDSLGKIPLKESRQGACRGWESILCRPTQWRREGKKAQSGKSHRPQAQANGEPWS